MEWLGFWIFMSVVVLVDGWLYSKGHDGIFLEHRTDAEKAIQYRQAYGKYRSEERERDDGEDD